MEGTTCRHCGEHITLGERVATGTDLHRECMEEVYGE